jgi:Flp pilus assembly protein TadD
VALPQFRAVVRERPEDPAAHYELAGCMKRLGHMEEAVAALRETLRLRPDWPEVVNDLAWLLATAPQDGLRDPEESLRLATRGLEVARRREPLFLGTAAAAHADAGRFPQAVEAQRERVRLARELGNDKLTAELEGRLKSYEAGKPYRVEDKQAA